MPLKTIISILLLLTTPAHACSYVQVCTDEGCYNTLVDCSREDMRRNSDDLQDRQNYNLQRGYDRWDTRGSRAERRRLQEEEQRRDAESDY